MKNLSGFCAIYKIKQWKFQYGGIEGSFTMKRYNDCFQIWKWIWLCATSFDGVTKKSKADYGVLAIENTITGSILPNYNLVEAGDFEILDEVFLNIQMYLMALEWVYYRYFWSTLPSRCIASMRDYLRRFFPQFKVIEGKDTASEAKRISENNLRGVAAIAGKQVADRFGLKILDSNIQDIKENQTRFVLVGNVVQLSAIRPQQGVH